MNADITAKDTILARIRNAEPKAKNETEMQREYAAIVRTYQREGNLSRDEKLHLFEDRLREYDAGVYHATSDSMMGTIEQVLHGRGVHRLAVPEGLPETWLPQGFAYLPADGLAAADLDRVDGVLSGCTLAIAITGTIVLQNAPRQGPRKLSLVPDYHLCVVFEDQVVETVPEAFAHLESTSRLPTTLISGPSATADIEMTRIRGVHGPRRLDVVLVS